MKNLSLSECPAVLVVIVVKGAFEYNYFDSSHSLQSPGYLNKMTYKFCLFTLERKEMNRNMAFHGLFCFTAILVLGAPRFVIAVGPASLEASICTLPQMECSKLSSLPLAGYLTFYNITYAAEDFGMLRSLPPAAVLHPGSVGDIMSVVTSVFSSGSNVTIAARGPGHSTNGQSQALNGIVIDMSGIRGILVNPTEMFVEAGAGELWVDVLQASLHEGLTPKSFTDYLHLSVGGTLSNAGVSGQTHRWGPQINNVLQLEIITGTGQFVTCSRDVHSDLFFAALGGLGQFGIITKARISLQPSSPRVRWTRALYADFPSMKRDQEFLISQTNSSDTFDYVEGFVVANTADPQFGYNSVPFPGQIVNPGLMPDSASTPVLYYIELAKNYNNSTQQALELDEKMAQLLAPLNYISTQIFHSDVTYFDFLERVHKTELILRSLGKWEVQHPWMDIFVPASKMVEFDHTVFKSIHRDSINGPIIVYPLNRNKWDIRMSAQTPDEEVFYLVAFLQSVVPSMSPTLKTLLSRNYDVLKYCQGLGCKQYLPSYSSIHEWQMHYGDRWRTFVVNKNKFDPIGILAPGQNMFGRGEVPAMVR